jgi:cytochrome c oxidase cbb3-type subunit III
MSDVQNDKNNQPTLPDHDYDGIREEDNPLPRWWIGLFIATIAFAIVYLPLVHMIDFLPGAELQSSIANAAFQQEQREAALEASGAFDKDPIAAGQKYYRTFCVSCHGAAAEGGIGPNLHDAFWIHTPYVDSIRVVISGGVPAKGMPTWGPILGDRKINVLAAYVCSLWNTPLPQGIAGKKAEGLQYDMAAIRKSTEIAAQTDTLKKKA